MERSEKKPTGRLVEMRNMVPEYGGSVWFWRSQYWARRLPAVQVKRKLLFDRQDVEKFIEDHKKTA